MWKKIYNIDADIKLINNKPTFITPLIFTLEQKFDKDQFIRYFLEQI